MPLTYTNVCAPKLPCLSPNTRGPKIDLKPPQAKPEEPELAGQLEEEPGGAEDDWRASRPSGA